MKLSEFRKEKDFFTAKASELSRQLAFAGIAVVWIFKKSEGDLTTIPHELLLPVSLLSVSLASDLFQYIYGGIAWSMFHRYHERRKKQPEEDPEVIASRFMNWPAWIFFVSKILCVVIAYIALIYFLFGVWLK